MVLVHAGWWFLIFLSFGNEFTLRPATLFLVRYQSLFPPCKFQPRFKTIKLSPGKSETETCCGSGAESQGSSEGFWRGWDFNKISQLLGCAWPIGILKAACFAKVFQEIGMWAAVAAQLWTYMKPWITHWSGGLRDVGIFQVNLVGKFGRLYIASRWYLYVPVKWGYFSNSNPLATFQAECRFSGIAWAEPSSFGAQKNSCWKVHLEKIYLEFWNDIWSLQITQTNKQINNGINSNNPLRLVQIWAVDISIKAGLKKKPSLKRTAFRTWKWGKPPGKGDEPNFESVNF